MRAKIKGQGEGERVTGVRVAMPEGTVDLHARRGVVLAAGDYASSPSTISAHKGPRFAAIEGINPHATGDGHRLAAEAGAKLLNPYFPGEFPIFGT